MRINQLHAAIGGQGLRCARQAASRHHYQTNRSQYSSIYQDHEQKKHLRHIFLTFLLGIGGQTVLAHTGGSDAGYRDNQTAASLIQAGEAEGAKILAAQAETSLLHLDEDAVLYATIANQSQTMMARPAVVCTWNGKLVARRC